MIVLCLKLRIDNSRCIIICAIGRISETIGGIITCDISNGLAYLFLSIDINDIIINCVSGLHFYCFNMDI